MVERCAAASLRQPRRPWGIGPDPPDRAPVGARALRESLELRQHRLAAPRTPPRPHRRALVRHGPPGTRPVRAHALGRAALAPDQPAREPRQSRDRHRLGRHRGTRRRSHRRLDDALRRRAVLASVSLHRHHPDHALRAREHGRSAALTRSRGLAHDRPHRARRDALSQAPPVRRGGARAVARGGCRGVVGESGAGKSQLFLAVLGLLPGNARTQGSARFRGSELLTLEPAMLDHVRGAGIGMVFQDPMSSLTPHLQVGEQIAEVMVRHRRLSRRQARKRALELLRRVQVADPERRLRQYPHQLSGGMRQRVMIAIALSGEPQLLIADEPTTALDVTVQAQILALLAELKRERGLALVLITHDPGVVAGIADRVSVMRDGRIVETGAVGAIFRSPREPYTRKLLREARGPDLAGDAPHSSPPAPAAPGAPPALELAGVSVRYTIGRGWLGRRAKLAALSEVSLELARGEARGVVGGSGCGKSTLVRALLQPLPLHAGRVVWMGRALGGLPRSALRSLRRDLQIIFQDPFGSLDPRMTVGEIVAEPLEVHARDFTPAAHAAAVAAALSQAGLGAELSSRYPHELSGGQCQRVGIARAMILRPQLLACDEPLAALDVSTLEPTLT